MVAEVIPEAYDATGRHVFEPRKKRFRWFAPNSPMGRHVTQPLTVSCKNLEDVRQFLKRCKYVSDKEQFDRKDYWIPPDEFERLQRGDCDDFALWTWRQLLAMGYEARFVCGRAGRYGEGHAWVTFAEKERTFLLEAQAAWLAARLPRLSTVRYQPSISVRWDGNRLEYYEHETKTFNPPVRVALRLVCEWLLYWGRYWPRMSYRLARHSFLKIRSFARWMSRIRRAA